ncbi:hypothetical protein P7C70_g6401, partial [Phenoliferia sp. Uapishka_3]
MSAQEASRVAALKEAFGSNGPAFAALLDNIAKVNFDAYKNKCSSLVPVQTSLSALSKKVPKFWFTSLSRCPSLQAFFDPVDAEALTFLEDVKVMHDEKDCRNFVIEFHFSSKNPFFSNTTLTKSLTVTPSGPNAAPAPTPYDLDADLYLSASTPIKWTSPDHDLTKKAPRPDLETLEEFDAFDGMGSFFNWFGETGRDGMGIGESLLEWKGNAIEYAAGLVEDLDDGSEGMPSDDDDDSEDEDPTKEVDLESEEDQPKKKKSKKA